LYFLLDNNIWCVIFFVFLELGNHKQKHESCHRVWERDWWWRLQLSELPILDFNSNFSLFDNWIELLPIFMLFLTTFILLTWSSSFQGLSFILLFEIKQYILMQMNDY
jgi:hypothetical protein